MGFFFISETNLQFTKMQSNRLLITLKKPRFFLHEAEKDKQNKKGYLGKL